MPCWIPSYSSNAREVVNEGEFEEKPVLESILRVGTWSAGGRIVVSFCLKGGELSGEAVFCYRFSGLGGRHISLGDNRKR